jgi:altronate dehydratase large subunit
MPTPEYETGEVDGPSAPLAAQIDAYGTRNGEFGVRNHVLVVPSVICSHIVAERIAEAAESSVCVPHDHGCGQIGHDHDQTERTLLNVARNPNVSGATVVGLGCEHLQSGPFAGRISDAGVPVRETAIQDAGGSDACITEGVDLTNELAAEATIERDDITLGDLTVGIVSSDLSESTTVDADPVVGTAVDALIEAGAAVLVAGSERLASHGDAAISRAATPEVAASVREAIDRYTERPGNAPRIRRRAGELSFDKVVGTWGEADIAEFVHYGSRATIENGFAVVDSPSRFEEAATALVAAGASIVVHITAEGVPTGHPVVPVVKMTGDDTTADVLADDMDINVRNATPATVLDELRRVADGEPSAAERHGLTKFAISRTGPSQ